MTLMTLEGGFL